MAVMRFAGLALIALSLTASARADDPPVDAKSGGGTTGSSADVQAVSGRAAQIFSDLDANSDGLLTADEVSADRRSFFEHLVRVGDKDKDGGLTKAEFLSGLSPEKGDDAPGDESNPSSAPGRSRFDPETFFRRIDRNGDGQLSLEELPEPFRVRAVAALQELGRDQNGTLSWDEFRKHVGMLRPRSTDNPGGPAEAPAFFRKLDRNGDGKLSRAELNSAVQALDDLDVDRDGEIGLAEFFGRPGSRGEARTAPGAGTVEKAPAGKGTGEKKDKEETAPRVVVPAANPDSPAATGRPAGAFKRFDTDGDGKVSREEAPPNLKRNFQKLDVNRDGYLDPGELRKALEQFRSTGAKAPKA